MDAAGGGEGREREGVREGGWFFQSGRGGERHEEVLGGLPRPRDLGAQKAQARTDDGRVKDARNVPHTRPHLLVARVQDVQHAVRAGNVQTVGKLVRGFGHAARRHFRAVLRSMAWPKKWSARALGLQVRKGGRALSPRSNGGDGGRVGAKGGAMRAFLLRLDSPPQSTTTGFFFLCLRVAARPRFRRSAEAIALEPCGPTPSQLCVVEQLRKPARFYFLYPLDTHSSLRSWTTGRSTREALPISALSDAAKVRTHGRDSWAPAGPCRSK